jgi:predicted AAA+ superfamily ATPase
MRYNIDHAKHIFNYKCKKFSSKPVEIEKSIRKYYSVDTGYINAKGLSSSENFGLLMENLVAVELKRRGCEFYYYLLKERYEIDFLVRENRKITEVIQVTYDEGEPREREITNGFEAARQFGAKKLTIVTWYLDKKEVREDISIRCVPLWKWLTENSSQAAD